MSFAVDTKLSHEEVSWGDIQTGAKLGPEGFEMVFY